MDQLLAIDQEIERMIAEDGQGGRAIERPILLILHALNEALIKLREDAGLA